MAYSDRDMLVATQIAYYDFDVDIIESNNYNATLRELLQQDTGVHQRLLDNLNNANGTAETERAEQALNLYNEIMDNDSAYGDWIVRGVKDDNTNSGFYGCLIETSDDTAIVGFRGTEGGDSKDWVKADFGLLFAENGTEQQHIAEEFMREINDKYDYEHYYTSGHSLGGNLSNHAAITAPDSMKDKIVQSYSFDGPGFSDDYLRNYDKQIESVDGKLTQYRWSVVGDLLTQPKNINTKVIAVKENAEGYWFQRHDTGYVKFDENGNVVPGKRRPLQIISWVGSKAIDYGFSIARVFAPFIVGPLRGSAFRYFYEKVVDFFSPSSHGDTEKIRGYVTADFLVDFHKMRESMENMKNCRDSLVRETEAVDVIRKGIQMGTVSSFILRGKLRQQYYILKSHANKLMKLYDKGLNIADIYERTEKRIIAEVN